jgi:hypothetical protein
VGKVETERALAAPEVDEAHSRLQIGGEVRCIGGCRTATKERPSCFSVQVPSAGFLNIRNVRRRALTLRRRQRFPPQARATQLCPPGTNSAECRFAAVAI